jgi:preprotein translocase subunit Sec61beta
MADSIQMPSGFGGLMRYQEEFTSYINVKPAYVILFVILIIALRIGLGIFLK